jgi:serine/threonine protein kinase
MEASACQHLPEFQQPSDCQLPSACQQPSDCQLPSACQQPSDCQLPSACQQPSDCQLPSACQQPSDCHHIDEEFGNAPIFDNVEPKSIFKDWVRIGRGGSGEVFSCKNVKTNMSVAIKKTRDSDYVFAENKIWSQIPESNLIVKLIAVYVWQDYVYSVMELMEANLTSIIPNQRRNVGFLPKKRILEIVYQLILGLKHLHSNSIVHGDIKTDNILIDSAGTIKYSDFGVATMHGEFHPSAPHSGTYQWKPPNAMHLHMISAYNDDVWSLGILFLELFGIDPPFIYEKNVHRLIHQISNLKAPPPLPDLKCYGEDFELRMHRILNVCLQIDPAERFSAEELLILFERIFPPN